MSNKVSFTSKFLAELFLAAKQNVCNNGEILVCGKTIVYDHSGWPIAFMDKGDNYFTICLVHSLKFRPFVPYGAMARLNALKGVKIRKKNGQYYLNGKEWDGKNADIAI